MPSPNHPPRSRAWAASTSRVVVLTQSRNHAGAPTAAARTWSIGQRSWRSPPIDDEDRLGAGVVHPDDSHRGASCQGVATAGEGLAIRLDPPPAVPRPRSGGVQRFQFCACVPSAVRARLSGAARFSAMEPVTGGRPNVHRRPAPWSRRGVSVFRRSPSAGWVAARRRGGSDRADRDAAGGAFRAVGVVACRVVIARRLRRGVEGRQR